MKGFKLLLIFGFSLVIAGGAQAATLADTGVPGGAPYYDVSKNNWVAGQFSVTEDYTITDVFGYFHSVSPNLERDLSIALYGSGVNVPGSLLQRQSFTVGGSQNSVGYDWRGLSNLAWDITAGDYWIGFEVDPFNAFINHQQFTDQALDADVIFAALIANGAANGTETDNLGNVTQVELVSGFDWRFMDWTGSGLSDDDIDLAHDIMYPGSFQGQFTSQFSNPLDNYALYSSGDGFYREGDQATIGLRVYGNSSAVPEPATMILFGTGLVGTFLRKRFIV